MTPTTYQLFLPYPPSTNRLWRYERGYARRSSEAKDWIALAALEARRASCRPLSGGVVVVMELHPRLTKKGKASQVRLDVDGPIKITLDALIGHCYQDDKQVVLVQSQLGDPILNGGLSVKVMEAIDG